MLYNIISADNECEYNHSSSRSIYPLNLHIRRTPESDQEPTTSTTTTRIVALQHGVHNRASYTINRRFEPDIGVMREWHSPHFLQQQFRPCIRPFQP